MKRGLLLSLFVLGLGAARGGAEERPPIVRLFEWERGYAIESPDQKGMAVYLWFYEWTMFDAMKPGQHSRGTHQTDRRLAPGGREGVLSSKDLTLRMTAAADGADLALTVRNNADHDFPPHAAIIPCFNPGPAETRNPAFANTNTFFLAAGGLERLVRRQIHWNAALRALVDRDAKDGPYAWSDKWPPGEPDAAGGLIVRESTDGGWTCGIAWEDFLSAQGHNPWECMHLSVRVGPLERGKSRTLRGKMYLLQSDKAEVLRRYRNDFAGTKSGR